MASQMADCQMDTVSVTVCAADYRFKASGFTVTFDGFTALYEEAVEDKEKKETALPPLEQGRCWAWCSSRASRSSPSPPPRYTEASLIKALEGKRHRAGPPPTRPSSPPSSTGAMWSGTRKSSSPPPWAARWTA